MTEPVTADAPEPKAASTTEDESIFDQCQRWRTHLTSHATAFRALGVERVRGWESPALDAWYAGHRTRGTSINMKDKDAPNVKPDNNTCSAVRGNEAGNSKAPPTTSFAEADTAQLAERYRAHCRRILPAADRAFFSAYNKHDRRRSEDGSNADGELSLKTHSFLDLGCAPGGVSKYLEQDLGWSGIGVTLPASMGGIDMDVTLRRTATATVAVPENTLSSSHLDSFELWEGDVSQPPATWVRVVPAGKVQWRTDWRFRFVNGGAVQDHGQRLLQQQQGQRRPELHFPTEDGEAPASDDSGGAILPWFTLFVPQLRVALQHVAEGGSIMIVYGAPHCASLFILLKALEFLYPSGVNPAQQVCVLETMHLVKPPVYVLLRSVHPAAHAERVERLLRSLDPHSDVLSPFPSAAGAHKDGDLPLMASVTTSERRLAKQRFWLGESDEGFAIAADGLRQYATLVEAVWARARGCLLGRRLRAEQALAANAAGRAGGGGGCGRGRGQGFLTKRPRSEES